MLIRLDLCRPTPSVPHLPPLLDNLLPSLLLGLMVLTLFGTWVLSECGYHADCNRYFAVITRIHPGPTMSKPQLLLYDNA